MEIFKILGIINIYLGILHLIFGIYRQFYFLDIPEEITYSMIWVCSLFTIPANIICLILNV